MISIYFPALKTFQAEFHTQYEDLVAVTGTVYLMQEESLQICLHISVNTPLCCLASSLINQSSASFLSSENKKHTVWRISEIFCN